ncbi:hypothetical protein INT44_008199 [Umbelopsis vinacea]|uniref:Dipeptidyl peptidase 3 n=1 Tax=Umbelopsis vinacea TaxID=44442 RepID=A0A8H7PPR5_9FUNG|nr:hypothetical protein INT44_008199 [Umbelopsis vinacea]KAI9285578.1 peptidase family M49-domain-containing protein [Umbelopsis sp. AD052]
MTTSTLLADRQAAVARLEAKTFFEQLSKNEKLYAHYMAKASFAGSRIILAQTNPHGPEIFDLIQSVFTTKDGRMVDIDQLQKDSGVSKESFEDFVQYATQFLGNMSNYRSFGDRKFIPRVSAEDIQRIVEASAHSQKALALWESTKEEIFSVEPSAKTLLGFPEDGHVSGYYSSNITKADIKLVQDYCEKIPLDPLNTRLFKDEQGYQLRIASAVAKDPESHTLPNGASLKVHYGDFSAYMTEVAKNIKAAIPFAANENQKAMLKHYFQSFESGSIDEHKESQRYWLKDIGPVVETNIGFIETYRDPQGVRAEWEGFVAMVNKSQTEKFENLVKNAPNFISRLPWPKDFERSVINAPDFTSLEVLNFATAGLPAGINIPNYSDITQVLGSKNVSLGNVLTAHAPTIRFPFVRDEDYDMYTKYRLQAFEVQVGTHELGHGTGILFTEDASGTRNFGDHIINPLTNQPIKHWYQPGQNFNSVFKNIASSYEECRAEAIAMVLIPHLDIQAIFGHEGEEAEDVIYTSYLNMARAGLAALELYDPRAKKWGQAHSQARFAILQVMIEAKLAEIVHTDDNLEVHIDRSNIRSVGVPAIADFLNKLQVYKATADEQAGTDFYNKWTSVPESWNTYREIVIAKKLPDRVYVQANTVLKDDDTVELLEYDASPAGMIQSVIEREL